MRRAACVSETGGNDEVQLLRIESIMRYGAAAAGRDPIAMLTDMMNDPYIHMHGPEHHTMVGAALMTAYRNAGGDIDLTACLAEMKKRGMRSGQCPRPRS